MPRVPLRLEPDGAPFRTRSSLLWPARFRGRPVMLKVAGAEEAAGADLLAWYGGEGAVRLMAREGRMLVLERAEPGGTLAELVSDDDAATRVLAEVARRLHAPRAAPKPPLVPLHRWFRSLRAADHPLLREGAAVAETLLASGGEVVPLHGDLHHANVVLDRERGWLALDPKGLEGERAYEVANALCNPIGTEADLLRRVGLYAELLGLAPERVRRFGFAHACLAAAWTLEEGDDPAWWLGCAERLRHG